MWIPACFALKTRFFIFLSVFIVKITHSLQLQNQRKRRKYKVRVALSKANIRRIPGLIISSRREEAATRSGAGIIYYWDYPG